MKSNIEMYEIFQMPPILIANAEMSYKMRHHPTAADARSHGVFFLARLVND